MTGLQVIENGKIVDSSSIVPIIIVSDVTTSRAIDTTYINTTGKTLFVCVSILCYTPVADDKATFKVRFDGTTDLWLAGNGINGITSIIGECLHAATFVVKPNQEYKILPIVVGTGVMTLKSWTESY